MGGTDTAIAKGFGIRILDPRPAIDRAVLEAKATAYGGLAAVTGVTALGALVGALCIRPPRSDQTHSKRDDARPCGNEAT